MSLFDLFKKNQIELGEEELKWNKMWDLWTENEIESPYAELMRYQDEINNGGHYQYFSNIDNIDDIEKELLVLKQILSPIMFKNLSEAYKAYLVLEEKEDEEFENIIELCDNKFYENENEIICCLKEFASKIEL